MDWSAGDFSPEEKLSLRQCSREVSLFRALPLGLASGGSTYLFLSRFRGSGQSITMKVALAGLLGYGIGRASGSSGCLARLRSLPGPRSQRAAYLLGDISFAQFQEHVLRQRNPDVVYTPDAVEEHNRAVVAQEDLIERKEGNLTHEDLRALNRAQLLPGQREAPRTPPPSPPPPPPSLEPPPVTGGKFQDEGFS